jgi:hypothetical protein
MKREDQRIAIAEACGWKQITRDNKPEEIWEHQKHPLKICRGESNLPNYLGDLNAMHEAEKMLYGNPNLPKKYTQQIKNAIRREAGVTKAQIDFDVCITATATQRAEAFLRTIGKWTKTNSIKESAHL